MHKMNNAFDSYMFYKVYKENIIQENNYSANVCNISIKFNIL